MANNKTVSTKEKLIERFKTLPRDFTFDEMVRLFAVFGFEVDKKGGSSGSRLAFVNTKEDLSYNMHRPHPGSIIKMYVMKQVLEYMIKNSFIKK